MGRHCTPPRLSRAPQCADSIIPILSCFRSRRSWGMPGASSRGSPWRAAPRQGVRGARSPKPPLSPPRASQQTRGGRRCWQRRRAGCVRPMPVAVCGPDRPPAHAHTRPSQAMQRSGRSTLSCARERTYARTHADAHLRGCLATEDSPPRIVLHNPKPVILLSAVSYSGEGTERRDRTRERSVQEWASQRLEHGSAQSQGGAASQRSLTEGGSKPALSHRGGQQVVAPAPRRDRGVTAA